jgi:hypothetical protein
MQFLKDKIGLTISIDKYWGLLTQTGLAATAGLAVYILVCYILRSEEMDSFWQSFRRRFFRRALKNRPTEIINDR